MKRLPAACVVPLILLFLIPSQARADASVVQDSCITVGVVPPYNVWTYLTVVNFSLPEPVCYLGFAPEPQPPALGCEIIGIRSPMGWDGYETPEGGANWFVLSADRCIPPGSAQGGFAFLLDPAYCCYVVKFYNAAGDVLLEQEECFTCQKVPAEENTWGHIKQLYE